MFTEKILSASLNLSNQAAEKMPAMAPMAAKCLPQELLDGLDTVKFWVWVIGGALFVIALMGLAVTMAMNHRRGEAGESIKGLGMWIGAIVIFGAATAIAQVFLGAAQNCG